PRAPGAGPPRRSAGGTHRTPRAARPPTRRSSPPRARRRSRRASGSRPSRRPRAAAAGPRRPRPGAGGACSRAPSRASRRPPRGPRARQAERLVPGGELEGAAARAAAERHAERLEQDAPGVVLGLLLGEAERVHLHAVAEEPVLGVGDAVAVARELVPRLG